VILSLIPKKILATIFYGFENQERFSTELEALLAEQKKPIAFAIYHGGIIEFLLLKHFVNQISPNYKINYATRIPAVLLESPKELLQRVGRKLKNIKKSTRLEILKDEVKKNNPIVLFIDSKERTNLFQKRAIDKELKYLKENANEFVIIPIALVWKRTHRTDYKKPGILKKIFSIIFFPIYFTWQIIFGSPYQPTTFRKLILILRGYTKSSLKALEVIKAKDISSEKIRMSIITNTNKYRRIILGPGISEQRIDHDRILIDQSFNNYLKEYSIANSISVDTAKKQAKKYLREIAAITNYYYIRIMEGFFNWVFKTVYSGIQTKEEDFEQIREIQKQGPIVFIPNHESYIDFLVLPYVLYKNHLTTPFTIAGINLNFWPAGNIIRHCGGIFIRRTFKGNVIYRETLKRYLAHLLKRNLNIKFFIEGTRSRNGKLTTPKYGILHILSEIANQKLCTKPIHLVPVSISYDKLTEGEAHKIELQGGEKPKESFNNLLQSFKNIFKKFGRVYARFGEPIHLQLWNKKTIPSLAKNLEQKITIKNKSVYKLAFEISHRINEVKSITPVGIFSFIFLSKPDLIISKNELNKLFFSIVNDLKQTRFPIHNELSNPESFPFSRFCARMIKEKIIIKDKTHKKEVYFKVNNKNIMRIHHRKNSMMHVAFIPAMISICHQEGDLNQLRSILEYEYFFPSKNELKSNIEKYKKFKHLILYSIGIKNILEAQMISCHCLLNFKNSQFKQKQWIKKCITTGGFKINLGEITQKESLNTQSIKIFLEMATNKGWLLKSKKHIKVHNPSQIENHLQLIYKFYQRVPTWREYAVSTKQTIN